MAAAKTDDGRRQLIFYATPTGPLADTVARYYRQVTEAGQGTTAQTYPPHCTLTGFFRREPARAAAVITEFATAQTAIGAVPDDAVTIAGLRTQADWVGLELNSPWLIETTTTMAAAHRLTPGDDELRVKDWPHLSLAYGVDDLTFHAALAEEMLDLTEPVTWELGLWERHPDGSWTRHT
jgi:ubiquitin-associated SH3 domain-containing protein